MTTCAVAGKAPHLLAKWAISGGDMTYAPKTDASIPLCKGA